MTAPRHPFYLTVEQTAVVVIDFQEKLAATIEEKVRAATVRGMRVLLRAAASLDVSVLVTEQYPKGLGPTVPEISDLLGARAATEKVVFDCSAADGFMAQLEATKARRVLLVGMETHICVLQTALGLLEAGYGVWVAQDAVCSRRKENWKAGLELMRRAGAVVAPIETLLFMWLGRSGTPAFKELSGLIK